MAPVEKEEEMLLIAGRRKGKREDLLSRKGKSRRKGEGHCCIIKKFPDKGSGCESTRKKKKKKNLTIFRKKGEKKGLSSGEKSRKAKKKASHFSKKRKKKGKKRKKKNSWQKGNLKKRPNAKGEAISFAGAC